MNTMKVPNFSAEASLYKTSVHYHQLSNTFAQANRDVAPSANGYTRCGACHYNSTGACVQDCHYCVHQPGYGLFCLTYFKACDEGQCPAP